MFALDFVSLLISKDQPNQASLSISPFLREHVGMGTLGADKVQTSKVTEAQREDNKRIAKGWKIQNLNKTADSILASATRLEKEIELETAYWKQVLTISENGWAICRLPTEKHTLGVRFGFSEGRTHLRYFILDANFVLAGPIFKNRSLAALRREPDGSISLDQGLAPSEPQSVRVRIYSNGEQTGCSIMPSAITDAAPVEARIRQARNAIFEAELWHELNRESRTLQAMGVRCKGDTIICPISPAKNVVLDLVILDSYTPEPSRNDDKLAEGISLALHLLQSYAHRQNFVRRTKPPGPLTSFKRTSAPYALLRYLITRANHQATLSRVHNLFHGICSILSTISHLPRLNYTVTEPPSELPPNLTATETTVVALFEHIQAHVTVSLSDSCTLSMKIRTSRYPLSTSNFNLSLEPADCVLQESCRPPGIVDQWYKAYDYILFVTSCALASSFASFPTGSEEASAEGNSTPASRWEPTTRPHIIRLVRPNQDMRQQLRSKQASFSLTPVSPPGGKNMQSGLKLRVNWECIGDFSERPSTALEQLDSGEARAWKVAKGEGYYEWIILEGESKVVGRGASGGEGSWGLDTPIKSLKEVMELAAST